MVVTGARGFVGEHLARLLAERGHRATALQVRLPDRAGALCAFRDARPEAIVHLAAVSYIPAAEKDPATALRINVDGTRSLLEALHEFDPQGATRFILVSTGQVYRSGGSEPLTEESPLEPATAYARTKLAAELEAQLLCAVAPARPLVIVRPFNHTGPGQRPDFAAPSFAKQTAWIEAGLSPEPILSTGALDVRRDFTDVRDVARAYALAAEGQIPPGIYNVASGRAPRIEEIALHFRSRSRVPFEIRPKNEPSRQGEVKVFRGSAEKLASACGWRAEIPLEKTLDDLLEHWREEARRRTSQSATGTARGKRE